MTSNDKKVPQVYRYLHGTNSKAYLDHRNTSFFSLTFILLYFFTAVMVYLAIECTILFQRVKYQTGAHLTVIE